MANFGASIPWMAKLNVDTNSYTGGFKCGGLVNTSITPNYQEASMYADNQEKEHVKELINADVALGVDRLPVVASRIVFAHEVDEDGEEIDNTGDSSNYVGYGFITAEKIDGVTKYRACVLLKVIFSEGEESFETKGSSIVFKNPTLSGKAMAIDGGEWRRKSPYFNTEKEADLWIQKKLNVVEECKTPTASVAGGRYSETQTVALTTATAGAKIKYTTDGTTPSEDNGTEYETPISIENNTGLRALAYKSGAASSGVMVEEYFISS